LRSRHLRRPAVAVSGALEVAAGLLEEDVVEARRVQLDVGDAEPLAVECADDVG
jgi:hypothetical protein